jgi:hypothetical protein
MSKSKAKPRPPKLTKPVDASRAQSAIAGKHDGQVPKDSYVGRLQRAAMKNFGKSGGKKPA